MSAILANAEDCCQPCGCTETTILPSGTVGFFVEPSVAALRTLPSLPTNQAAYLTGLDSAGDGGGGWYYWSAASTATDDGVTIIKPSGVDASDQGRWLKTI